MSGPSAPPGAARSASRIGQGRGAPQLGAGEALSAGAAALLTARPSALPRLASSPPAAPDTAATRDATPPVTPQTGHDALTPVFNVPNGDGSSRASGSAGSQCKWGSGGEQRPVFSVIGRPRSQALPAAMLAQPAHPTKAQATAPRTGKQHRGSSSAAGVSLRAHHRTRSSASSSDSTSTPLARGRFGGASAASAGSRLSSGGSTPPSAPRPPRSSDCQSVARVLAFDHVAGGPPPAGAPLHGSAAAGAAADGSAAAAAADGGKTTLAAISLGGAPGSAALLSPQAASGKAHDMAALAPGLEGLLSDGGALGSSGTSWLSGGCDDDDTLLAAGSTSAVGHAAALAGGQGKSGTGAAAGGGDAAAAAPAAGAGAGAGQVLPSRWHGQLRGGRLLWGCAALLWSVALLAAGFLAAGVLAALAGDADERSARAVLAGDELAWDSAGGAALLPGRWHVA